MSARVIPHGTVPLWNLRGALIVLGTQNHNGWWCTAQLSSRDHIITLCHQTPKFKDPRPTSILMIHLGSGSQPWVHGPPGGMWSLIRWHVRHISRSKRYIGHTEYLVLAWTIFFSTCSYGSQCLLICWNRFLTVSILGQSGSNFRVITGYHTGRSDIRPVCEVRFL